MLSHAVYLFAEHPDVLKKAREEILEALGPVGTPTVENMRGLKYRTYQLREVYSIRIYNHHPVKAVLNETLRLFSPLPGSRRDTRDQGVALPRSDATYNSPPVYIPPRTPVAIMPYLMQRNKALWGPDAEEFKPGRWFDPELQKNVAANPSVFIPFVSGPRNVSIMLSPHLVACC